MPPWSHKTPAAMPVKRSDAVAVLSQLGNCSVNRFMRDYWQKKPLLIRQAFPMLTPLIDRPQIAELARCDHTESRLISRRSGEWSLKHGPFENLPATSRKQWTLLVQGVDLYSQAVHRLLRQFRFLSDARLDDVMVSIASDGGGVGPHWDSYDVFLLQAEGQRRWQIGPTGYPDRVPECIGGLPLKIIKDPQFTEEFVLDPGDMLYLPPGWAHDGVAIGACTTLSIGFRAPGMDEFLQAWHADQADRLRVANQRYQDAGARATESPGKIPPRLDQTLKRWIATTTPSAREIEDFIGRYLSEPKSNVWFDARRNPPGLPGFVRRASKHGLQLDRQTRMLYRNRRLYVNGESSDCPMNPIIRALVNDRQLSGVKVFESANDPLLMACLHQWWSHGWIHCDKTVHK